MKFNVVTPSFNSEKFIAETIESVVSQAGEFEIEYIIVDNCSSDKTVAIVQEYKNNIENKQYKIKCKNVTIELLSEKDRGMYDAVNKGLGRATGEIYSYINADDIYLPGAFDKISRVFKKYPAVQWLKGITSYITASSEIWKHGQCFLYNQDWIRQGIYGRDAYFIQQDSVFWRSELWKKSGGFDPALKMAGDYFLWIKFARFSPLYTLKEEVSCFRKVEGQKSRDITSYYKEYEKINIPEKDEELCGKVYYFFSCESKLASRFRKIMLYIRLFGWPRYRLIEFVNSVPVKKHTMYHVVK